MILEIQKDIFESNTWIIRDIKRKWFFNKNLDYDVLEKEPDIWVLKFMHKNHIVCIARHPSMWHYCWYVWVPKNNMFFWKWESELIDIWSREKIDGIPFNWNYFWLLATNSEDLDNWKIRLDMLVNVHGWITYSHSELPVNNDIISAVIEFNLNDYWYFWFDCGHCNDEQPFEIDIDEQVKSLFNHVSFKNNTKTYKDFSFVKGQVLNLSDQLHNFD